MNHEEEITRLSSAWYELVGLDHHKDKDCHWHINKTWSYGAKPIYRIEHYGYIYKDVSEEFETMEEAEKNLFDHLQLAFNRELVWAAEVLVSPAMWDEDQVERAKKIKEIVSKI